MTIGATWLALVLAANASAPAMPATAYELHWTRAPGAEACIDAPELAGAVGAWLGRPVFAGGGARTIVIEGRIAPTASGWNIAIAIRDADGGSGGAREIELDGADCRAIDESLVLVLGLIVDPEASAPPVPRVTITSAPPPVAPGPAWDVEATVSGAAAIGVLPGLGGGARASLLVDPPRLWPVALAIGWWAPGETGDGARRASLTRWEAGLRMSTPAARAGGLRLSVGAGAALARIAARGVGFVRNGEDVATMASATLAGRAAVDVSRHAFVVAEAGADIALVRPRFVADDGTELYRVARAALVASLGVGVRF